MENIQQEEGVAVTPHVENEAEEMNQGTTEETTNAAGDDIHGEAADGTVYDLVSPAVVKYRELFPEVTPEAAIGSVVSIHNSIAEGAEPAGETLEVYNMIVSGMAANSEELNSNEAEDTDQVSQ